MGLVTFTAALALALPQQGVLVSGKSLGGVHLGDSRQTVIAHWGPRFGVCRRCPARTLYFTYRRFQPQGAGVTFRGGKAVALFTLWSPPGWRSETNVVIGANAAGITKLYGALPRTVCPGYNALTMRTLTSVTAFFLVGQTVYGFGLMRPNEPVCR